MAESEQEKVDFKARARPGDMIQDEVTQVQSKSGNPMFGDEFPTRQEYRATDCLELLRSVGSLNESRPDLINVERNQSPPN
jgi:hypothetical protein